MRHSAFSVNRGGWGFAILAAVLLLVACGKEREEESGTPESTGKPLPAEQADGVPMEVGIDGQTAVERDSGMTEAVGKEERVGERGDGGEGEGTGGAVEKMPGQKTRDPGEHRASRVWSLKEYRASGEFRERYGEPVEPPPFDFGVDLAQKSLAELRLLRNGIFARRGYLFQNAVVRGYFNQFDWYQPIFWDTTYQVSLNRQETAFVEAAQQRERELLERNYVERDGARLGNVENVVNLIQFKEVPDALLEHLERDGFALVEGGHRQLFHVYDRNQYQAIPSFVTTDLFLQVLHVYYSNLLRRLEKEKLVGMVRTLVTSLYKGNQMAYQKGSQGLLRKAARFNLVYYAIAANLLQEGTFAVPEDCRVAYEREFARVTARTGMGSEFLDYRVFDYTQLQPRGHYAYDDTLKGYFSCVRWLGTAPFLIDSDVRLGAAVLSAHLLATWEGEPGVKLLDRYRAIDEVIGTLAGEVDNLSVGHVVDALDEEFGGADLEVLLEPENLAAIRASLEARNPERIRPKAISKIGAAAFAKIPVYVMPGRYTFDGEILQNLIHVLRPDTRRPFPKGLDIFAVMGNREAERILFEVYQEDRKWPGYADSLRALQSRADGFRQWDAAAYNKRMELLLTLPAIEDRFPGFMQTPAWQRRSLNTALAGWTELKHEMLLYIKQPLAAQAGEGGGLPRPVVPGYVEPHTAFWAKCVDLLRFTHDKLEGLAAETWEDQGLNAHLSMLAGFLLDVSEKELRGEALTQKEFDRIMWIGGEVEHLTLAIFGRGRYFTDTPDEKLPLVADVYTYNSQSHRACLEEAVGRADEIYAVVEIDGLLHLTRGAVFSYYEFTQPTDSRLTDEVWQGRVEQGEMPERPVWIRPHFADMEQLRTRPHFTYEGRPTSLSRNY